MVIDTDRLEVGLVIAEALLGESYSGAIDSLRQRALALAETCESAEEWKEGVDGLMDAFFYECLRVVN